MRIQKVRQGMMVWVLGFLMASAGHSAQTMTIDPTKSKLSFAVSNFGVRTVHGYFSQFSGTLLYDPKDISRSKVRATLQAASIDTANHERDEHLRKPDFFEVAAYPTLSFESQMIERVGDGYRMTGLLTIKGISKPVTIPFTFQEIKEADAKLRLRAQGETSIQRNDFGINYGNAFMVGKTVRITLSVEAHE